MNARERLSQLIHDADKAAAGGHASVAARLLQHRELLDALRQQVDANEALRVEVAKLLQLVRLYPVYPTNPRDGADPTSHRWALKVGAAPEFDRAIERLTMMLNQSKEPTP